MAIDFTLLLAEPFDPCAAYAAMRPGYLAIKYSEGGAVQKVMFRDREVWFQKSDLTAWDNLMNDLERQCREKQGLGPRRMAITGGYRTPL